MKQKKHNEEEDEVIIEQPSEVDEYKNKYLRALADYQNLEKRYFNEKKESEKHITRRIVERFLNVMDDIERAQAFHDDQGLTMVAKQFQGALSDLGVTEIDIVGKEFDPYTAEAIEIVDGEEDNIVVDIVRKGYMMGDMILRPAQVRVSKKTIKN